MRWSHGRYECAASSAELCQCKRRNADDSAGNVQDALVELAWESIGGLGKQVSALMGFPGQDVLATGTDSVSLLSYTRIHDLTIYVDQSADISCSAAEGRAAAGMCAVSRLMEKNSIFSPGGNGLTGTQGTGTAWAVGNCAIAMPAATGSGGNGLRVAEIENLEIATTGVDPMAAQYPGRTRLTPADCTWRSGRSGASSAISIFAD